jgi:hypothetical protein
MYDIIGDIHGYVSSLEALLRKMDYEKKGDTYRHPERKAFFVGDLIDRGPEIQKTVNLVRAMVENGAARAVMGNHEYNALCFAHQDPNGGHLRPHSIKNIFQHIETLKSYKEQTEEYQSALDWFLTLPLWYEDENIRVVHASWDTASIEGLRERLPDARLSAEDLIISADKGTDLYNWIDVILKGREYDLPEGVGFHDKDKSFRTKARAKWWERPDGETSLEDLGIPSGLGLHDVRPPAGAWPTYSPDDRPVFFGHYWLKGLPHLQKGNVCCLDFSVAKKGYLAAYRYNGEKTLDKENLVYVSYKE